MYQVQFLKSSIRELKKLDKQTARRIVQRIEWLAGHIETIRLFPLKGDLAGLFKLRDGSYRIIYQILRKENLIIIHSIGHRKDIYKLK